MADTQDEKITLLRQALVGLVGVDGKEDLVKMEIGINLTHVSQVDKDAAVNAVHALLATIDG